MIQNYIIKNNTLYLYLNYDYEFSSFNKKGKSIFSQIKEFINNKAIDFKGNKIVLIVSGIIIGTIFINSNISHTNYNLKEYTNETEYVNKVIINDFLDEPEYIINVNDDIDDNINMKVKQEEQIEQSDITETQVNKEINETKSNAIKDIEEISHNENISDNDISSNNVMEEPTKQQNMVTIYRSNGNIISVEFEDYLIGVVAGEMPASFDIEALKTQAVIARTYALKAIQRNKKLTDTASTQVYIDDNQMHTKWGNDYDKYYNKIKQAVNDTKGLFITYNGDYIDAVYFANSNGYTEDAENVWGNTFPYLKSVESSWDINTNRYESKKNFSFAEASSKLGFNIDESIQIYNILRNNSHRVSSITINDKTYTGIEIRNIFNLNSADFDIEINNNEIIFTTYGYGHGVGLSQYGANGMAKAGYNYEDIIKYYYHNVEIKNTL
ncbi:MAG: stage II sporulation protein D [Bacilli bacterium]|nr:stage II sporulation protein D [Bacilli bacterium]